MSLFRDESPVSGAIILDPVKPALGPGSGGVASGIPNGGLFYDATKLNAFIVAHDLQSGIVSTPAIQSLAAAVTNANPTSATNLMTQVFDPGVLSVVGKTIYVFAGGEITTGTGTTTTVAITINDGTNTRTVLTWTTGALTTAQTNLPWEIEAFISINTAGSSGKVFAHGGFGIPLTAPTAGVTYYNDQNVAASSTIDFTKATTWAVNSLFGSSNAGNSVTQDSMILEIFN